MTTYDDFAKLDIRVGKIISVDDFPEARKPAYQLTIDFGTEIGTKHSSVQVTNYTKGELLGRQVICVVNFPIKQIGPFFSEVLTLGAEREEGGYELLRPDPDAKLGSRIY
ncbi:tRNA-binding protein [Candidatus Gottesmanbacteria bacterium]|nr:tRNA-binding protein [Candidatus Gottesmanbacteria bacterium]